MHIAGAKEIVTVLVGQEVALASEHTDPSSIMIYVEPKQILETKFQQEFYTQQTQHRLAFNKKMTVMFVRPSRSREQ